MQNQDPPKPDESPGIHFLDYWRVIRSRKEIVLAAALLVILTGTAVTFMLPQKYKAQCKIRIQQDELDMNVFGRQMQGGYSPFFMMTEYEILKSRKLGSRVVDNLDLATRWGETMTEDKSPLPRKIAISILLNRLSLEQVRNTSTLKIAAYSTIPEEAAEIANELAVVYREHRLSLKYSEIKRGLEALENELKKQALKVDKAEEEVERLREKHGLTMVSRGVTVEKLKLSELEGDRITYQIDMIGRKVRLEKLEQLEGEELINSALLIVYDRNVEKIRQQLTDSEVALKLLLENYGENHPDVRRMGAGVRELKSKLDIALKGLKIGLRADYEVAKAKLEALEQELEKAKKADFETSSQKILPFERAERNLYLHRSILAALQAKIAQEGIEIEVPRTPVEIFDTAETPSRPVSPNFVLNIVLSVVVGLVLGVGLAYFIEYLDTSIKTVDDIERYLGVPVIGVIPQRVKPLIQEGPDSPHAEAYRVLRTNFQFTNKGVGGGAFAVVSGGVGEGKSLTLFNLAYTCAQMGEKVLIVDSDLRRPVQHTILGMSNRFGLTNVLMRDVPIEETIKTTSEPNLHFLPSGKLLRTSVGVLDTQRIRDLIKNLKARYDYVFFDSPPIMGVSDASIIASEVDGVLLVVQYRKYPRTMSARAKRLLENVGGNITGVVLNNINVLKDDYYYYYHSYYSQYGESEDSEEVKELAAVPEKNEERF